MVLGQCLFFEREVYPGRDQRTPSIPPSFPRNLESAPSVAHTRYRVARGEKSYIGIETRDRKERDASPELVSMAAPAGGYNYLSTGIMVLFRCA